MESLLRASDVAKILGVAESTVYSWTKKKVIPHCKIGNCILFKKDDIFQLIEDSMVEPEKGGSRVH